MSKYSKKIKSVYRKTKRSSLLVYLILRILVIICMVLEILNGNIMNAMLCVLSLILFILPFFIQKTFKIVLPNTLEIIIFLFIFSAEILGEINNFYGVFPHFDTILHTLNGFLCAGIGFALVNLLNENVESFNLSPFFVALVAFTFSMTVGVVWEFFEYGMDQYFNMDMQKDEYVTQISTVTLDPLQDNNVVNFYDIDHTIIYDKDGKEIATIQKYLDLGINDTMKDLFVNFLGAMAFSIFGYLYLIDQKKYSFAKNFIPIKKH